MPANYVRNAFHHSAENILIFFIKILIFFFEVLFTITKKKQIPGLSFSLDAWDA